MNRNIDKCKGCGAPIFFEQGIPWYAKKVPVLMDFPAIPDANIKATTMKATGFVSHFINCPKANEFSKGKKNP